MVVSLLSLCLLQAMLSDGLLTRRKCRTDRDCPIDTCCPPLYRGKRSADLTSSGSPFYSVCTPLSSVGGRCYNGFAKCPRCRPGLICQGTVVREVPHGEIGICIFVWRSTDPKGDS